MKKRELWPMFWVFTAYFIMGKLSLQLAFIHASAAPIWPPSGIALAALLLGGRRLWPAIFAGAFFVNMTTTGGLLTCLGIACGNTLEAFAAAWAIERYAQGQRVFELPQNILKYSVFAGLLSTTLSASIGIASLWATGHLETASVWPTWLTWWFGDMSGIFTVAPPIILWARDKSFRWEPKKGLEGVLLTLALGTAALIIFGGLIPGYFRNYPLAFLIMPCVLWAVFRFGEREASTSVLMLFIVGVLGTMNSEGPFIRDSKNESLLLLQLFVSVLSVTALMVAASVAQRKAAEKSLRQYASIVENSNEAIIGKTLEGVVTSWNRGAEAMYGWTAEEAIGRHISFIAPSDRKEEVQNLLLRLKQGERVHRYETYRVRKDGTPIDVSLTISPILGSDGDTIGAATIAQNITGRKELENQREKQAKALEEINRELARRERIMRSLLEDIQASKVTLEEQKRSLQEANKRLEAMSALKDEFVATVSHELRTPLTAIKEGISLLIDRLLGPLNEEQADFLATVDLNIDRLTELINNMLDLSKIEAGHLRMLRRPADISQLVRDTVQNYRTMAGRRRLRLEMPSPGIALADPSRILQVLGNLFSNAVKFTKDDGTITMRVWKDGDSIMVSVDDDGVGIASEDQSRLFKKFSQVGQKRAQGTGLGLALSKELVELHGGRFQVRSEPGKGASFTFSLPAYSPKLAMTEYFKEQLKRAEHNKQDKVGMLVMDAAALIKTGTVPKAPGSQSPQEDIEVFLRKHLHESDLCSWPRPDQWMVITVSNVASLPQITQRLTNLLLERAGASLDAGPVRFGFGIALYPADGNDVESLFRMAQSRMSYHELSKQITGGAA